MGFVGLLYFDALDMIIALHFLHSLYLGHAIAARRITIILCLHHRMHHHHFVFIFVFMYYYVWTVLVLLE